MKRLSIFFFALLLIATGCQSSEDGSSPAPTPSASFTGADGEVRLMTLNPGHFHAGLVQKYSYPQVDSVVHVYAPDAQEVETHLALINRFNTRDEAPTNWVEEVYRGDDYLEKMLEDKPGNVMVVAGNNARKIEYIQRAVDAGLNVLADKPMVIHPDQFATLKATLEAADAGGLLVYDIMTERNEITSILQKELSQIPALFGELVPGTVEEPAISKESVHYFSKQVAGAPLVRPPWFFDVDQQGEAIVDVSTHLVDLILWEVFPEEPIDYQDATNGIDVLTARSWATEMTPAQFRHVTQSSGYPNYLLPDVDADSTLHVAANGEFVFAVRGVHGKVSVRWGYENPTGGDTHYSIMRGTQANLVIRQDAPQEYKATLYVEPTEAADPLVLEAALQRALSSIDSQYAGLRAIPAEGGWEIVIPEEYKEGHEEHFTRVTEQYLRYLVDGELPEWERTNLLTKYYITTQAYQQSR